MAYATVADFVALYGEQEAIELSNLDSWKSGKPRSEIRDAAIIAAIERIQPEIDAKVGTRYALPLPEPVPRILTTICLDLARYRLDINNPRVDVLEGAKRAYKQLDEIAKGTAALIAANGELLPTKGQARNQSYGETKVGTMEAISYESAGFRITGWTARSWW